ncbi:hypothetical protein [Mucilaginibacter sp.]|uniref:hypothetical protein n=1 Tax=Mucilaginibacter sp. TaxID=1882438 RepID=UPI0025D0A86E|nr:hypothetical protein [Mucilaginibacter sp.]
MLTFKQHFGIPDSQPVEFQNIPLEEDLEVFIDPFLITNNRDTGFFNGLYVQLTGFFTKLNRDYIVPNDQRNGLLFLDNLHEPNEYHLGYSASNKGRAISATRAGTIFEALRNNRFARGGVSITNQAHSVLLLVTGIGQDIMSDTIENVCRDKFAAFTLEQCLKHNIPTESFQRHYYNAAHEVWEYADFELPSYLGKPIILLPKEVLSSPRAYVNNFNYFVAGNFIGPDIIKGKITVTKEGRFVKTLKDGTKRQITKNIVEVYRKPKSELVDFVVEYNDSVDRFTDYAKEHYPPANLSI